MDNLDLLGKRKRKIDKCPNPLFLNWLNEWREDAAAKGNKSQFNYKKAIASLKKYPLPLASGKECKILDGFGDKTCAMLDKKLEEHISRYGSVKILDATDNDDSDNSTDDLHVETVQAPRNLPVTSCFSIESGSDEEMPNNSARNTTPDRRCLVLSGPREYIPQYRSGPYAIVMTLYKQRQESGNLHLQKKALMKLAQPLADKSFTIPDPGSRYTAWSSMGTLIKKGLVIKDSNPAKYHLTETGSLLAEKLLQADATSTTGNTFDPCKSNNDDLRFTIGSGPIDVAPRLPNLDINVEPEPKRKKTSSNPDSCVQTSVAIDISDSDDDLPETSLFQRLSKHTSTTNTNIKNPVTTSMNNSGSSSQKRQLKKEKESVESVETDLIKKPCHPGKYVEPEVNENCTALGVGSVKTKNYLTALPANPVPFNPAGLKFIYVDDENKDVYHKDKAMVTIDDELGIGFLVRSSYEGLLLSGKRYKLDMSRMCEGQQIYAFLHNDDAPDFANYPEPTKTSPVNISDSHTKTKIRNAPVSSQSDYILNSNATTIELAKDYNFTCKRTTAAKEQATVLNNIEDKSATSRTLPKLSSKPSTDSQTSINSLSGESQEIDYQNIPVSHFTLTPGSFEIVLITDKCEVYGTGAGKETLINELKKNQVPLEVRALQVGDFLWIARTKRGPFDKVNKTEELVLDHIVERKRMDDLAGSIVDGRFKEQKFRLKNSGLRKPIYLVEDYGSVQHFSINQDALNQAITNTQIIDNFYVKRTRDIKESVAYLTIMTRYLQGIYSKKTLHACSKKDLSHISLETAVSDSSLRLMTYEEFARSSVKTRKLTVQETFGKHLVQINGITVEKAAAIVNKYPSPSSLIQAYGECDSVKEKEALLSCIKFGTLNRGLNQQISKLVYWLYSRERLV